MATRTRWATIGLGVLAVILAIVAIMYPTSTIAVILLILAVALLIIGISRVLAGVTYKGTSRFSKSCMIGVGVLSIIVAIMIMASPLFGFFLVSLILGVTLLLNGIESIVSGVTGKIEHRLSKSRIMYYNFNPRFRSTIIFGSSNGCELLFNKTIFSSNYFKIGRLY